MQFKFTMVLATLGVGALLHGPALAAAQAPSLGSAQGFAVLGGSTVTNANASTVTGDLGVSPGTAITGFPPGILTGTLHAGDSVASQAQGDVTTAYNALAGAAATAVLTGQDLGGLTLTPGVYFFAASAPLNGVLTLDAQGDPSAVFIFQIGSTLLPAINSSVQVINGAQEANVFWQVGSSATLAAGVAFKGNIVALSSITLSVGSTVAGRALARTGAVTMDTSDVTIPSTLPLASAVSRNGSGRNPAVFQSTSLPISGSAWTSTVNIQAQGMLVSRLKVGLSTVVIPLTIGEVLCGPPVLLGESLGTGTHSIAIPADTSLLGVTVCVQAMGLDSESIELYNAIDLTIGF